MVTGSDISCKPLSLGSCLERVASTHQAATTLRSPFFPRNLTFDALRRLHSQLEERMKLAGLWQEHEAVFPSQVGTPLGWRNLNRSFKRHLERAGFSSKLPLSRPPTYLCNTHVTA